MTLSSITASHARPMARTHRSRQRGVGLIEVLVAVLILALGLLGMAGLQSKSLRASQSSYARTQAVMLSYYMLDAMRADRNAALGGSYNTTSLCSSGALTGTSLPDNSRKHWIDSMKKSLGDITSTCGAIDCDVAGLCSVKIIWNDERAGGLGAQTFETKSRL
jgi:type IV pilus assembly protein PilV